MARLSTGQLPACAPRMRTKITVSSPISRKKKIVTSCVSKINFLLQLYFIINSLMCLSEARSIFIMLFFQELGSSKELGGDREGRPHAWLWPISSPSETAVAELEGRVLALWGAVWPFWFFVNEMWIVASRLRFIPAFAGVIVPSLSWTFYFISLFF